MYHPNVYVVVIHKPTGRAYTLNRGYGLITETVENAQVPDAYESDWDGWREGNAPAWAEALPDTEFHAYWPSSYQQS